MYAAYLAATLHVGRAQEDEDGESALFLSVVKETLGRIGEGRWGCARKFVFPLHLFSVFLIGWRGFGDWRGVYGNWLMVWVWQEYF